MSDLKNEWTVESAMEILQHPTVDGKIWAEAVEWLLLYGPPEIRKLLTEASAHAANKEFPGLKPQGVAEDGELVYSVAELAEALGISEEEASGIIAEKERRHGIRHLYDEQDTKKVQ